MIAQQKQQQELQDQVSNGSSLSLSVKVDELSAPGVKEEDQQPNIKIQEKEEQV